jgi:hypothetical protein
MQNEGKCVDLYGERLNVGDEVIPVLSEILIMNIRGVISEIRNNDGYYFLVLSNKEGEVLYDGTSFEAKHFTTQERFDERENENNVYSLTFYNNKCWSLTSLPLTNRTNPNYEFPEGTTFISLNSNHMYGKDNFSRSFFFGDDYFFAKKGKVKFCYDKKEKAHFLKVLETGKYNGWRITRNHKYFETDEELVLYIRAIIQYFNNADLTHVNNDVSYTENPEGKIFEKNLFKNLKNNNI